EHGEKRRERCVHRQVGAICRALQVASLLAAHLLRLLAQEVEVRTLLGGKQLAEAHEGRLAGLASDLDERLTLAHALPPRERQGALQLRPQRTVRVLRRQLERAPERLPRSESEREHRECLRQVEEDRLAAALPLLAQQQVGNEGPSRGEQEHEKERR